ncbi:MAG: single-stranded DNA-binding protein [Deltaproteobacteria bacterium]|nr:single-stranded DNA-binding protein [Deltaproteobacteria bacterium]
MAGVNKVILVGRLGADPEMKYTSTGTGVCRFNLATSENWTGKDGQKQERTEWHRVIAWTKLGELCNEYLKKGRQAYVEGRLQTRSWDDKNGTKRYTTEVVATTVQFLGSAGERSSSPETASSFQQDSTFVEEPLAEASPTGDEDIPF